MRCKEWPLPGGSSVDIQFTTYSTWTKTDHFERKCHQNPQTHHHKYIADMQTITCEVFLKMTDDLNTDPFFLNRAVTH